MSTHKPAPNRSASHDSAGTPERATEKSWSQATIHSVQRLPRKAPTRAEAKPRRVPFAVLVVGLLLGGMSLLLALNTASAAKQLERGELAERNAVIAAQVEALRQSVALSEAPPAVAAAAQRLGMVPAAAPAFMSVAPDGKVTVLGSPAPAVVPAPLVPSAPPPTPKPSPTPTRSDTSAPSTTASSTTPAATKSSRTTPKTPAPLPALTLPGGAR